MSDDSNTPLDPPSLATPTATSFDVTERTAREMTRREIIKLFRSTDLSPREILQRLMDRFYAPPISDHDRRMFLRHATVWVRDEALIRGAASAPKPNAYSNLLTAFQYLDQVDPGAARILELAYVAEITSAEIADVLNLAPELVADKLRDLQAWLRRMAAGEPHTSYQTHQADPSRTRLGD
jgi:hypothetical protein